MVIAQLACRAGWGNPTICINIQIQIFVDGETICINIQIQIFLTAEQKLFLFWIDSSGSEERNIPWENKVCCSE